jgi:deoxycytidylate deaminase
MRRIDSGSLLEEHLRFIQMAAEAATSATCHRAQCGAILVVQRHKVIGTGWNSPPLDMEENRTCDMEFDRTLKPKYDLTCCVHAEVAAVLDAYRRYPGMIPGSTMYFSAIGGLSDAEVPFCSGCSRIVMAARVAQFALWNEGGVDLYTVPEYDRASFAYHALKQVERLSP